MEAARRAVDEGEVERMLQRAARQAVDEDEVEKVPREAARRRAQRRGSESDASEWEQEGWKERRR